jgi:hypothetical protein
VGTHHPQLEALQSEIESATARAQRLAIDCSDKHFVSKPGDSIWSVAECIEHLNITTREYLPLIDNALDTATATSHEIPKAYRQDLIGRLLTWMMEPPYRLKMKTTAQFIPATALDKDEVIRRFMELQSQLSTRVDRCSGYNLSSIQITSPFNEKARYSLYSAFCILLAHERRHLWQAEQILYLVKG